MKGRTSPLGKEYLSVLRRYLRRGGEEELMRAYDLGREAVRMQLGVLDMVALHQECLVSTLLQMLAFEESREAARRAADFFLEAVAPFEMRRRGMEEANALLQTVNVQLQGQIRTTEEELEQTKRVEALRSEFIATASHELRTPLTSINGSLGLLRAGVGGELTPKAQQLVAVALRSTERLVRLVNEMLDLQRIESDALSFDVRPCPARPLMAQAVSANEAYAAGFGVHLVLEDVPEDIEILVDVDRFMQVMANLLSNAVKFSPRGETVTLGAEIRDDVVCVSVSDAGPGIPEEFRSRLFEKFAQAVPQERKRGSGLGLSITKAIVERLGGRIGFAPRPSGGTTFFFELPLWSGATPPATTVEGVAQ